VATEAMRQLCEVLQAKRCIVCIAILDAEYPERLWVFDLAVILTAFKSMALNVPN
jgi:hypothetical protein